MQADEFQTFVTEHEEIQTALRRAVAAVPAKGFGVAGDLAALVLLFPVVRFILMEIGLPWLVTLKKYSEVERRRVEDWIDRHAQAQGLDPDVVEAASQALMKELEQTTGARARKQWERLLELLKK